jgi:hypothetical protein
MGNEPARGGQQQGNSEIGETETWIDRELADTEFCDERLGRRFRSLLQRLAASPGQGIPLACEDWANTKAAYRFLDNDRVSEAEILAGHFQATRERAAATDGPILVLHDTTEFSFKREDIAAVGMIRKAVTGKYRGGALQHYTACGILMHSSLAVTTEQLPLGLVAAKFWTREKFKGTNALKKKINPTRVPIEEKESFRWLENLRQSTDLLQEPTRCVHIGDRESDIYELFCTARDVGTHFLLRTCVDRLAGDGTHTIADEMAEVRCKGVHRVEVRDRHDQLVEAILELRFRRVRVLPPIGKQSRYPQLELTVLHATERARPRNRERIDWKLITDLPVTSRASAIEKLHWYAMRWKIETFHKILKSGCRAEHSKLRTAERLVNLLAIFCILGWRIFWLTMLNRSTRQAAPTLAFTPLEIDLLNRLSPIDAKAKSRRGASLDSCLTQLARLGGYLARAGDAPPGNTVMWRGLSRLTDIEIGYLLGTQNVGN